MPYLTLPCPTSRHSNFPFNHSTNNSLFRSHNFSQNCTSQLHPVIFHGLLTGFMINFCCVMTPRYFLISCSRYNSPRGGLAGIQFHGGIRVLGQFGNGRWWRRRQARHWRPPWLVCSAVGNGSCWNGRRRCVNWLDFVHYMHQLRFHTRILFNMNKALCST